MCGIYITNLNFSKSKIHSKLKEIYYRGPDNFGYRKINDVSIAHLRLSIIDVNNRSNQPFSFDGLYLTFNGEIYNFQDLKDELIKSGYTFNTDSDTEVLLKGYHFWREKVLIFLNGMFSFSIYDSKNDIIFSARDRLGVKPFYYFFDDGEFEISSQISPLKNPNYTLNTDSVSAYFKTGYIPSPLSIFKEIKKLPPGNTQTIDLKNKTCINKVYWDIDRPLFKKIKTKKALNEFETLLKDAIQIRLNSDVPFGCYLSGGIDSGLIASYASKQIKNGLKTFTIGFENSNFDESKIAKSYSDILGTNHKEFICTPKDLIDLLPKFTEVFDEPFSDPSSIPSLFLAKKVKKDVTAVLSGDGGDESFFGYNHFYISPLVKIVFLLPITFRKITAKLISFTILSKLTNKESSVLKEIFLLKSKKEYVKRIFISNPCFLKSNSNSWQIYYDKIFNYSNNIYQNIADLNIKLWLENNSNVKVDRSSMGYSVEVRSPFLDYRIIEYSRCLPISKRYSKNNRKFFLKELLKKFIPKSFYNHPKKGFSIPLKEWTRDQIKDEILNVITPEKLKDISEIDSKLFLQKMEDHFLEKIDFSLYLWRMFLFIKWKEKNIKK